MDDNKLEAAQGDMGKIWKVVNKATNRTVFSKPIGRVVGSFGKTINVSESCKDVADKFNKFLLAVGERLASDLGQGDTSSIENTASTCQIITKVQYQTNVQSGWWAIIDQLQTNHSYQQCEKKL